MVRLPLPRVASRRPGWRDFVPALTALDHAIGHDLPSRHFREASATDEAAWDELVGAHASGDFLHSWAWGAVAAFDREPMRRFVLEEDGAIVAVGAVQARRTHGILTTWYVPHGPVLDYDDARAAIWLEGFLDGLRVAARRAGAVAVRLEPRLVRGSAQAAAFVELGLEPVAATAQVGQTQLLDLSGDEADTFAATDAPTRRKIRRAAREGVRTVVITDPDADDAVERLARLVRETEARSGVTGRGTDRIRVGWRAFAGRGTAAIIEAWAGERIMASGMVVVVGDRSFYLFSGSSRELPGEPKSFPSYAMQWEMIRTARRMGARAHDLWGIAPAGAGPEHRWYGIGTFKRSFGGQSVTWAGSWDLVLRPSLYRARGAVASARLRLFHPVSRAA
jgi:lipid II:glycine glycyltransferase (peptidoglycan interpeptide bridge formation enzyme)